MRENVTYLSSVVGPKSWQSIQARATERLNRRTMMAGKRDNRHSYSGPAGEIAVAAFFPYLKFVGNHDFDFIAPNGKRFEVKTRSTRVAPKPEFDIRVPSYSFKNQKCDGYIFCFVQWANDTIERIFVVGWCSKQEFAERSDVAPVAGAEAKASGFNQREGGEDLRFAQINQLNPVETMKSFCT